MAEFVDVIRVPVLMPGTWNASTGREPVTDDDLNAVVEAYSSGLLDPGVIKLGHTDPRHSNLLEDGEPAYGQVVNPRIEDGVLYVDFIHMPRELAESRESAYPRVSVELARNVTLHDADGEVKAQFPLVLTAVALLGATPPAVKGLSVKASALAEDDYDTRTVIVTSQFSFPGNNTAQQLGDRLSATVRQAHAGDYNWTYLEDFTDTEVIFAVEGDADVAFYRQSYKARPDGSVELTGDMIPVVRETKWVAEGEKINATETTGNDTTTNVPTPEPDTPHAMSEAPDTPDPEPSPEGDITMSTVDKDTAAALRRKYGLPNNASHEDILGAILEAGTRLETPDTQPGTDETDNDERREAQEEEAATNQEALTDPLLSEHENTETTAVTPGQAQNDAAALAESLKGQYVSASAFAQFQAEHEEVKARLAAREAAETKDRRDNLVRAWFSEGRIGPDEAKNVRENLDKDESVVTALISSRAALFSGEKGHAKLDPEFMARDTESTLSEAQYETDDAVFGSAK